MSNQKYGPQLVVALIFALGHSLVASANLANAQSADDVSLVRNATRNFFEASQRKDVDGLLSLWSAKAPELTAFTEAVKKSFAEVGNIELQSLEIHRVTVEGAQSIVRLTVEMQANDLKSGKPAAGFGRGNRTLRFAKEDGRWKLWQYRASEEELALALLSAKTASDQTALLEAEQELLTSELLRVLRTHAETFNQQGDLSQALVALRLTQLIGEKIADDSAVAFAVNRIGVLYYQRGEYQPALDMFVKLLPMSVTMRDRALTARTLNNIGTMKRLLGDYAQALEYLLRGLKLGEELGDKAIISFTLNNIGTIHGSQGNHTQALEYFQRTLKLGQASGDKPIIANALNNIGITHYSQREYERALEYYRQSLALREELNDKRMAALTLNNIGIIHREQGDYRRALEYYRQSLALREKFEDQAGTATVLNHIGIIHYLQGDFQQALQISGRVIEIATRLASPEILWRGYELAGKAHGGLKQFQNAEKALVKSIETIEKMRHRVGGGELAKQRFFEDKLPPYIAMVDLSFSRNRPVEALSYAELAKARTLLDVLRNGRVHITKAMSAEEQELERVSNAELNVLNSQLHAESQRPQPNRERIAELEPRREKARLAHEAYLTSLYVKHPELKVQRGETTPITTAEVAGLLPGVGTALLEYVVADEKSYLIVLTRDYRRGPPQITLYPLKVTARQLSEVVNDFRRMLADRDLSYQATARQLYDLLLKPAEQQLRGKRTLCVVPDKALWELPFQALQPRAGVHLVEDFAIFYAPSLTVLREMMKKRVSPTSTPVGVVRVSHTSVPPSSSSRAAKTLFALGNPQLNTETAQTIKAVGSEERLGPLPEAEKEVQTLARLYGAANSRVFIGSEAREGRVKIEAPKYEILHFATHGLLDDRNPMFSHLTLAQLGGDPQEDGLLEAREIINLDLSAELAVLSACQMARGWVGAGEGVIGMSWAFFVAGVPTTVASQWKVDSASTTNLMINFHRRLTMRHSDARAKELKAESLRQAALGLLRSERYRHPFYWAGFVMVGDGW
jgi:CHAT domain-containing protein/Tfp pilus assembly protein PilF